MIPHIVSGNALGRLGFFGRPVLYIYRWFMEIKEIVEAQRRFFLSERHKNVRVPAGRA